MAGRVHREAGHSADLVGVAVVEQPVELRAVALELGAFVEDLAEGVLHHGDVAPDADLAAQLPLDIGRGGQVVGVDMGLDQPFQRQAPVADMGDQLVGMVIGDAAGGIVDVHHGIDDGAGVRSGVLHHIADGVRGGIEEALHLGLYGQVNLYGHGNLRLSGRLACGEADCSTRARRRPPIRAARNRKTVGSPVPSAGSAPPGQKPAMPQPTPKVAEPRTRRRSITRVSGSWNRWLHRRGRAAEDQPVAGNRDAKRAGHDEGKAWVPGAGDVEEVQHLGRVDHPRDRDAEAEDQADDEGGEKRITSPPSRGG
jgi:hypothetical protein